jgi:hypothetical protein
VRLALPPATRVRTSSWEMGGSGSVAVEDIQHFDAKRSMPPPAPDLPICTTGK